MKKLNVCTVRLAIILAVSGFTVAAAASPHIFWASDPVRPDETVMVQGSDLGGASAVVEMARLDDGPATAVGPLPEIKQWTRAAVLQASDETLKFVVPADWKPGVFAYRITAGGATTEARLLNAPDPWWMQGDEGESASSGGWLRVLGKSLALGGQSTARLEPEHGDPIVLRPKTADSFCLGFVLPMTLPTGQYIVRVHNGSGGNPGWRVAGKLRIAPAPTIPDKTFSVLDFYGPDAEQKMRDTLVKYNQPLDRTEGIQAALTKAKDNGGGTVYFPPGRYTVKGPLVIPERTRLKGAGTGLVTLWWGSGHFNLDGGGPQGRALVDEPKPPQTLIYGPDFELEDLSLYLPLAYEQGVVADRRLRMSRVRVRIDHYWLVQGRGNGVVARLGRNSQVTDCDILAKGDGIVPGQYALLVKNIVRANKSNTPLGGSRQVIVENNHFVSMDPTAYQNIAGSGRNIYYYNNHQESLYGQQADYSFTFDAGGGAYLGGIAAADGTRLTLAADPTYPDWAKEKSDLWRRSVVCILSGRGAGQWRDVTANHGRSWEIDRPFDTLPDATSIATIVPFNGRVLIVGNHFEDANWVNAGYGTSIEVVCAENHLARCADLMNFGVGAQGWFEPSWYVQFFDNQVTEGRTHVGSNGDGRRSPLYSGTLTRWAIHRRQVIAADNSGSITLGGNLRDAIVEGCTLDNANSEIKVDEQTQGIVLRNNEFVGKPAPRYEGGGLKNAVVLPALEGKSAVGRKQ